MYPYKFEYYRFQLVPKKVVQLSIDNVAYTYDEIKAKKNESLFKFYSITS